MYQLRLSLIPYSIFVSFNCFSTRGCTGLHAQMADTSFQTVCLSLNFWSFPFTFIWTDTDKCTHTHFQMLFLLKRRPETSIWFFPLWFFASLYFQNWICLMTPWKKQIQQVYFISPSQFEEGNNNLLSKKWSRYRFMACSVKIVYVYFKAENENEVNSLLLINQKCSNNFSCIFLSQPIPFKGGDFLCNFYVNYSVYFTENL